MRVAVLDSGINPVHSHVGGVSRSVVVREEGGAPTCVDEAPRDVIGHGTALAGVIHHWAPDAELLSVRVLGPDLRASMVQLTCAIDWAVEAGARLINLSLGTRNPDHEPVLAECVARARERGAFLVSAFGRDGEDDPQAGHADLPARLDGVVSVAADSACTFEAPLRIAEHGPPWVHGCPYPRDLPGRLRSDNFRGPSVATAHATGIAAAALASADPRTLPDLLALLGART